MKGVVWLHHGPFPGQTAFVASEAAWVKLMARMDESEAYPPGDAVVTTFYETKIGKVRVITVHERMDTPRSLLRLAALIAHEVQHVWQGIKEDIGEHEAGKESEAYMVQWLLTQVLEAFEDTRFKLFKGKKA